MTYRARRGSLVQSCRRQTLLTAGTQSALLVGFLVIPAPPERSLGDPTGEPALH